MYIRYVKFYILKENMYVRRNEYGCKKSRYQYDYPDE